jgi:hypothetical protein
MRKLSLVALCLFVLAAVAMAQEKMETKWNCSKPSDSHSFDVGDVPNHSYVILQGSCTATSSNTGEKTGAYTEFQEVWKDRFTNHGRFTATTDSGDKLYYVYEGAGSADTKKPVTNKWKIVDASGKHKGMKASGGCTGNRHDDSSSDWTCTGAWSAGKSAAGSY